MKARWNHYLPRDPFEGTTVIKELSSLCVGDYHVIISVKFPPLSTRTISFRLFL